MHHSEPDLPALLGGFLGSFQTGVSERVHRRKETRNPIPGGVLAGSSDGLRSGCMQVLKGWLLGLPWLLVVSSHFARDQMTRWFISKLSLLLSLFCSSGRAYKRDSVCTCLHTHSKQLSKDSISVFFLKKMFDLATKRSELLIHATTWKNLQKLTLGEKAIASKGSILDGSV